MAKTVLVVNDQEAGRYVIARVLRRAGYRTLEAGTGHRALLLSKRHPDLVLLDARLPDLGGAAVCERLKAGEDTRAIPVVLFSAEALEGLTGGILADAYVPRGLPTAQLVALVRAFLGEASPDAEAEEGGDE
jgi:CheY-like chemotaxis protein